MIIEMTLLMPVFLFVIYMYIMAFLYYVDMGKQMSQVCESVYEYPAMDTEYQNGIQLRKQGGTLAGQYQEEERWANITITVRRNISDPVTNLRRWQVVTDAVR